MPRFTEYQSPVSGLFPHRLSDRQSDGASGHVSASIGLRLSPPRPAARARVLLRGLLANPTWAGDGVAGLSRRWVLPRTGRTGRLSCSRSSLVGRITLARRPFEGWSPALALASGALGLLAVWTLASATWSDAPARALSEFDRTLLYGLVLVLTGSVAARVGDLSMLLRWTAAAFAAIALAGLLTRLLPDMFPISSGFLPERVSFPLTYWNAMGVACALGAAARLAPDGKWARARHRQGRRRRRCCRRSRSRST